MSCDDDAIGAPCTPETAGRRCLQEKKPGGRVAEPAKSHDRQRLTCFAGSWPWMLWCDLGLRDRPRHDSISCGSPPRSSRSSRSEGPGMANVRRRNPHDHGRSDLRRVPLCGARRHLPHEYGERTALGRDGAVLAEVMTGVPSIVMA